MNEFAMMLAQKLLISIEEVNIHEDKLDLLRYGIEVVMSTSFTVLSIVIVASYIHCLLSSIVAMTAFSAVRRVSSGAHGKTVISCTLMSILILIGSSESAAVIGTYLGNISILDGALIFASAILLKKTMGHLRRLRLSLLTIAFLLNISWFLCPIFRIPDLSVGIALVFQAASTTRHGSKVIEFLGTLLDVTIKRGEQAMRKILKYLITIILFVGITDTTSSSAFLMYQPKKPRL